MHAMPDPDAALRQQLTGFAAHLRDAASHPPPPGIEPRRIAVYRDLVRNNIDSLLATNFPVIRKTLGDARWAALVDAFLARHRATTPLFPQLGRELLRFLDAGNCGPPWLAELAHYEWTELAIQLDDAPVPPHDPAGDLLRGIPLISPFSRALQYAWPVQRIGPAFQPDTPPAEPTLILARRDGSGRVRFAELSPLAFRLRQLLEQPCRSGSESLQVLAAEAGMPGDASFIAQGAAMLERMRAEGSVLGTAVAAAG